MDVSPLDNVFQDLGVGGHYCNVRVETHKDNDGDFHARYVATMAVPLEASLSVEVQRIALVAGADPAEMIKQLADEKLRPFASRLDRAACAAANAWHQTMNEDAPDA